MTTRTSAEKYAERVALAVFNELLPVIKRHEHALRDLQDRLAQYDAKPSVKFCGVWKADRSYTPGDAATRHGSLWICKAPTRGEPSKDFTGWQLAVKRGSP